MKAATILFACAALLPAQAVDRTKPPATPPIPSFKLPPVHEQVLPNGLRVVTVNDPRFPLVTLRLGFFAGMRFDPPNLPGVAEMTGMLLTDGTKKRTSRQIAEELAAIGGNINGGAGSDSLTVSGNAL